MNIENDIPMCYAVMNITENLDNELGDISIYVAAGCYVLKQVTEYLANGDTLLSGEVVFMWNKDGSHNIPKFDNNGRCSNKIEVLNLYTNVEDAIQAAEEMNKKGLVKKIMNLPMEKMSIVRTKAPEIVNKYKNLSKEHLKEDQNIVDQNLANDRIGLQKLKKA